MAKGRRTPQSLLKAGERQLSQKLRICFRVKAACSRLRFRVRIEVCSSNHAGRIDNARVVGKTSDCSLGYVIHDPSRTFRPSAHHSAWSVSSRLQYSNATAPSAPHHQKHESPFHSNFDRIMPRCIANIATSTYNYGLKNQR